MEANVYGAVRERELLLIENLPTHTGYAHVVSARLTLRQRRVLRSLLAGSTNREIAGRLGFREQTVKNHLSVIYSKLGVRNRLELAVHADRYGLLDRVKDDYGTATGRAVRSTLF